MRLGTFNKLLKIFFSRIQKSCATIFKAIYWTMAPSEGDVSNLDKKHKRPQKRQEGNDI